MASASSFEASIAAFEAALQVYTAVRYPVQWAKLQLNLSVVYIDRQAGERRENIEQAIYYAKAALQVFTRQAFPTEWARAHNNLGNAYTVRLVGEQRANQEQAIASYQAALEVFTHEAFSDYWATVQLNLGNIYANRLAGEKSANQEQAIRHCEAALQVYSQGLYPYQWATVQNNLGILYFSRVQGRRRENLAQSIVHFSAALQVHTSQLFPFEWAKIQGNLMNVYMPRFNAYTLRFAGEEYKDQEQAIRHGTAALQVYTREQYPIEWARILYNLAVASMGSIVEAQETHLTDAVAYCTQALQVYTPEGFPLIHRKVQFCLAQIESQRRNWPAVHVACQQIDAVTELLIQPGMGTAGRIDALEMANEAVSLDALALVRMGRIGDALLALERGRARGLAMSLALNQSVSDLIHDLERRNRYIAARNALSNILHMLDNPSTSTEQEQRSVYLERHLAYQKAREDFDQVVAEVRAACDPSDFLQDSFDAGMLLRTTEIASSGHAIVYLTATPWGGLALAMLGSHASSPAHTRFVALDLPKLTHRMVLDLAYTALESDEPFATGGLVSAQIGGRGSSSSLLPPENMTWREFTTQYATIIAQTGNAGQLAEAIRASLNIDAFKPLLDQPTGDIAPKDLSSLLATISHITLQLEIQRNLEGLADTAMRPLVAWLQGQGATSLTLVPCGLLALFPLTAVSVDTQRTVADCLPTSIAPSARSLLHGKGKHGRQRREGVYALGNPLPTNTPLEWSEAEALTIARSARKLGITAEVRIQERATREWLTEKLAHAAVIDISCHGRFQQDDFLRSALMLADRKHLTLADMLHGQAELHGLRLLVLSACQTAILDDRLQGVVDEVHSLAAVMVQAGAQAVLGSLWPVDDRATYLLIVRFFQEWLPWMDTEPPAVALARAQTWLRTVTNRELARWQADAFPLTNRNESGVKDSRVMVRGDNPRYDIEFAGKVLRSSAQLRSDPEARPYEDSIYWAGFQVVGW